MTRPATDIKGCRDIQLDKHTGIRQIPWVRAFHSRAVLQYVPISFYRHIPNIVARAILREMVLVDKPVSCEIKG